jgi:hypothetical protein
MYISPKTRGYRDYNLFDLILGDIDEILPVCHPQHRVANPGYEPQAAANQVHVEGVSPGWVSVNWLARQIWIAD